MAAFPKPGFSLGFLSFHMDIFILVTIFLSIGLHNLEGVQGEPIEPYDMLYASGVEAYNSGKWADCFKRISAAIENMKKQQNIVTSCRIECQQLKSQTSLDANKYLDLAFFDSSLRKSVCIRKCKKEKLGFIPEPVSPKIEEDFQRLEHYNYLQLCAYKIGDLRQAVGAAYTFLLANPGHQTMSRNIGFYKEMKGVVPGYFRDLEIREYNVHHRKGVDAYADAKYSEAISHFEESLRLYFIEEEQCRASCEGPFDHDSLSDQMNAIADHYIAVLECRRRCPDKLATTHGKLTPNFLAYHYNYLQFSYYSIGDLSRACQALGTYLLLDPTDEEMNTNRDFYLHQPAVDSDSFNPPEDMVLYNERRQLEAAQLDYVKREYVFPVTDMSHRNQMRQAKLKKMQFQTTPIRFAEGGQAYTDRMARHLNTTYQISEQGEEQLKGKNRVIVDNFITKEEAEKLVELTKYSTQGDGYSGQEHRTSPHTEYEKFVGMTVNKAAELAADGIIPEDLAQLYLTVSERTRAYLEDYWNLLTPLYFHFTHLVSRTALDEQTSRKDLSHPIHSDNCHIQADGSCPKVPPAYYQRDFSAIVYLNNEFEGGEFIFAHKNLSTQLLVKPKVGRMVGFEAGDYHGVKAVTKGYRCAIALWYTMHEPDREEAHHDGNAILHHLRFLRSLENNNLMSFLKKIESIRVTHTEDDLNGPERFAADGLVTREQCAKLINLANQGGQVGDGYTNHRTKVFQSPHTTNERFAALTVKKAAESGGLQGDGYFVNTRKPRMSPHTNHEMFEGLTVLRATKLAASGAVDVEAVELYLQTAEMGRALVEKYFNLKTPLYFDFTHLVCRTALDDDNTDRQDLSHPVHSDNCILQPDGTCKREAPAYVQRDYSAIIYLNGDFKGGEFFFTHPNLTLQKAVKPHRGMLMGFNAGSFHGVKAVKSGQRCAIALWFTLNRKFKEQAHSTAWKIISTLKNTQRMPRDEL